MMRLLALALVLAGCDWSLHRMQEQPKCTTDGTLAGTPCNLAPPDNIVAMDPPDEAPPPLTRALLERGRDRFERFCAPCHGVAADGDSYVARAMTLRRPPSLVDAKAQSLPDERILTVIQTGYGVMPSYGNVVPVRDRYAILQFLRAMQSREVALDELPPQLQQEASSWLR